MSDSNLRRIVYKTIEDSKSGITASQLRIAQFSDSNFAASLYVSLTTSETAPNNVYNFILDVTGDGKHSISGISKTNEIFTLFVSGGDIYISVSGTTITSIIVRKEIKYGALLNANIVVTSETLSNPIPLKMKGDTSLPDLYVSGTSRLDSLVVDNITIDGNTISSTSNGNIVLDPDGTGSILIKGNSITTDETTFDLLATNVTNLKIGSENALINIPGDLQIDGELIFADTQSYDKILISGQLVADQLPFVIEQTISPTKNIFSIDYLGNLKTEGSVSLESDLAASFNSNFASSAGALKIKGGIMQHSGANHFQGNTTIAGDLAVNNGDITTTATTFNLVETTATTLNIGLAASITMGASNSGKTTIRNATTEISNALTVGTTLGITGLLNANGGIAVNTNNFTMSASGVGVVNGELTVDNIKIDNNTISSKVNTNGNITIAPDGLGQLLVNADTLRLGDLNAASIITTNGTGGLTINTNSGTNSGFISIPTGLSQDITISPTGKTIIGTDLQVNGENLSSTSENFNLINGSIADKTAGVSPNPVATPIVVNLSSGTIGNNVAKTINIGTGNISATSASQTINIGSSSSVDKTTLNLFGNLNVSGTVTAVSSNEVNLGDSTLTLNSDITTSAGNADGGIQVKRLHTDNTERGDAEFLWDEANKYWEAGYEGTLSEIATQSKKLDFFTATTSAELANVINDEIGIGDGNEGHKLVFSIDPVFTRPSLGAATGTSLSVTGAISGASLTLSTTPLAISSGGTGSTTKAAAFDALSPMDASGDIIYGGTSGAGTKLAKGTDGQILKLASGIPSWANEFTYTHPTPTRTDPGVVAESISQSAPSFTSVSSVTSNSEGHVTAVGTKTFTIPSLTETQAVSTSDTNLGLVTGTRLGQSIAKYVGNAVSGGSTATIGIATAIHQTTTLNMATGANTNSNVNIATGAITSSNVNIATNASSTHSVVMTTANTNGHVAIQATTNSTTPTTHTQGALRVTGGAGFGGNVYIGGNLYFSSDARLKKKIEIVSNKSLLESLLKTDVWKFVFNKNQEDHQVGIMAQDIVANFPEYKDLLVSTGEDAENGIKDKLVIRENKFIYVLWAALQEEAKKRHELEVKLNKIIEKLGD